MGIFLPGRKVTPRRFSYEPRYYNPEREERLRRRLRIERRALSKRRNPFSLIYFIILLLMALYVYNALG
ncbi:hypothetical protein [Rhodothermus marinus]|uniref:hypothetical protein n=1 Tax=Rhodothermus marinus TaxID=29549 RepID=UPI0012BA3C58|nr:hypothetical protein [Rhodothermus marinus]BBM69161.1 hypothetical protein RmaAA213_10070 [Rhodothermus marinus]BBM72153.1 hypothetical protein RmaAA338_10180 [Rhodothermus marinus]